MDNHDFLDIAALFQQEVQGNGDHLRLGAEGGDENLPAHCHRVTSIHWPKYTGLPRPNAVTSNRHWELFSRPLPHVETWTSLRRDTKAVLSWGISSILMYTTCRPSACQALPSFRLASQSPGSFWGQEDDFCFIEMVYFNPSSRITTFRT